jgi:hypothetical protein
MDSPFGLAIAVSVLSLDEQCRALDSGGFTHEDVLDFHFPAASLGPPLIHAHQHVRPIAGFRPTRSRVDAQNAVTLVVRAIEEDLQLERIQFLKKLREVLLELGLNFGLRAFRLGLSQLDHDVKVFQLLLRLEQRINSLAQRIGFFDDLLCLLAIVPKGVPRHQGRELRQTLLRGRYVKETSAND